MNVKLTNAYGKTYNGQEWSPGLRVFAANQTNRMELCSDTVIHFYSDPLLAVLMNPVYGNYESPLAYRFEPDGDIITDGTKSGCRSGAIYESVALPEVTTEQRIRFAIYCALEVYQALDFVKWAEDWLSGKDQPARAADAAVAAADAAAADAAAKNNIDFIALAHKALRQDKAKRQEAEAK